MKRFFLKIVIFTALVVAGQTLIARPPAPTSQLQFLDMLLGLGTEIVYLGDDTVGWIAPRDTNRLTMPGILERLVRPYGVAEVRGPHYQPATYRMFCRYLARQKNKPEFVIIPINLRVFSAEWFDNPATRYPELRLRLAVKDTPAEKFIRPLSVFLAAQTRQPDQQYARARFTRGTEYAGRLGDIEYPSPGKTPSPKAFRQTIMMRYLSALSPRHPWVRALAESSDVLLAAGITPVFYVSPVDVQTGEEQFGQEFSAVTAGNVAVLRAALGREGVIFLDLSRALRSGSFSWRQEDPPFVNGHLTFDGRMAVVQNIAGAVKSFPVRRKQ